MQSIIQRYELDCFTRKLVRNDNCQQSVSVSLSLICQRKKLNWEQKGAFPSTTDGRSYGDLKGSLNPVRVLVSKFPGLVPMLPKLFNCSWI